MRAAVMLSMVGITGWASPESLTRYFVRSSAACDAGDMQECASVGWCLHKGEGAPKDLARGFAAWKKSCEGGSPDGCDALAYGYEEGAGTPRDLERAHQSRARKEELLVANARNHDAECAAGSGKACTDSSIDYEAGRGVAKNVARGRKQLERACALGYGMGCTGLAEEGPRAQRLPLYLKGCRLGDPEACGTLAGLFSEPPLVGAAAMAPMIPVLELTCRRAATFVDGRACMILGELVGLGYGAKKDPAMAAVWLDAACELEWGVGCEERDALRAGGSISRRKPQKLDLPYLNLQPLIEAARKSKR